MNSPATRLSVLRPLAAACSLALASCASTGGLRNDPGFTPATAAAPAGLPDGLDFNAASLSAEQCAAWLDHKLPPYIWHGEEKDFTLTHGRVTLTGGVCRQYRVFSSPATRTWHLREIPANAVTAAGIGPVTGNLNVPPADRNFSFEVTGPWTRKWETQDVPTQKITSRGSVKAESVTLYFTSRAAAQKAREVILRLAALLHSAQG